MKLCARSLTAAYVPTIPPTTPNEVIATFLVIVRIPRMPQCLLGGGRGHFLGGVNEPRWWSVCLQLSLVVA